MNVKGKIFAENLGFTGILMLATLFFICCPACTGSAQEGKSLFEKPRRGVIANVPNNAEFNGKALILSLPDSKSKVLGYLPNKTEVVLGEMRGAWVQITAPQEGFVAANLIKVIETDHIDPVHPIDPTEPTPPLSLEVLISNSRPEDRLKILQQSGDKPFVPIPKDLPKNPLLLETYFKSGK